ncbi:4-hydroxy-tetrahydrodipicolinate reductase [Buchnera aphidicola (Ceratovacuna keduensis)]|uniref:4-hydroxy-tetrahydrodipicolinate reductase n=1 Tax=Buchnera aphidicola TaxID=9 RepID=UPI0031B8835B
MKNKKIRIAVSGANGRMGKIIIKEIFKIKNIILSILITKKKIKNIQYKNKNYKIKKCTSLKNQEKNFDVIIDFSEKKNTIKNIKYCVKNKKNIIIGTTGFNDEEEKFIKLSSKKICIVKSSNFSNGINLIYFILKKIIKKLKDKKIKIKEEHHKNKKDSPSGTSIEFAKIINKKLRKKFCKNEILKSKNINFISKRKGNIIGNHSIIFSDKNEIFKISHKAKNRSIFAIGAIQSAIWCFKKKFGLFSMKNIINKK